MGHHGARADALDGYFQLYRSRGARPYIRFKEMPASITSTRDGHDKAAIKEAQLDAYDALEFQFPVMSPKRVYTAKDALRFLLFSLVLSFFLRPSLFNVSY